MANLRFPDYSLLQYTQPKQRFQFLALYQLPEGLLAYRQLNESMTNLVQPNEGILGQTQIMRGSDTIQGKHATFNNNLPISDFLTMSTQNFPPIDHIVNQVNDETFYNAKVRWAGRRQYPDTIAIQFREYVQSPITRIMEDWQRLANDPVTNNIGYANNYKGRIVKLEIDPNYFYKGEASGLPVQDLLQKVKNDYLSLSGIAPEGEQIVTRQVVFEGVWPTTIPDDGGQYNEDGLVVTNVTFSIDRFYEDKDWARYFDTSAQTPAKPIEDQVYPLG